MRIGLVRREYITHLDGVNRFIALLYEAFEKLGHESVILSWGFYGVRKSDLPKWFKESHGLEIEPKIITLNDKPSTGNSWIRIGLDWFYKGSKLVRKLDLDAVILNGIIPLRFKPIIAVNHGIHTLRGNRFYNFIAKSLYKRADAVVSVSNRLSIELRDWGIDVTKVIALPMKLPKANINDFTRRENVIVHVGIGDRKNPWISIRAAEILREKIKNLKLVITGGHIDIKKDFVDVVGKLSLKEYIELLSRAKALILPSSYETFSYAVLEAMACGTPVVVSNAVPEEVVINGLNGIRVNSLDPKEYAKALENVITSEELWLRLSNNGLDFVKRFDYLKVAEEYLNLIYEIEA